MEDVTFFMNRYDIQVQAFGMDITKEEGGQIKIAPHESSTSTPQSSIEETGESTPDEGGGEEGTRTGDGGTGESEAPVTFVDLLGYDHFDRYCTFYTISSNVLFQSLSSIGSFVS